MKTRLRTWRRTDLRPREWSSLSKTDQERVCWLEQKRMMEDGLPSDERIELRRLFRAAVQVAK